VYVGDSGTISGETWVTGDSNAYTTTNFVCDNSADTDPTDGLTIVPADAGKNITCTIVNTRKSATLKLAKQWINAKVNDNITAASTGFGNNAQLNSTANTASETDTGTGVTVFVGESGTITGETWVTGDSNAYTTTNFVCDNSADTDPTDGLTIVEADSGKTITCTIVNSRKSATLQLAKQWINAKVNDNITAAATGFSSPSANAQLNSTANTPSETDTGTGVTVYVGDSGTITGETWVTGDSNAYTTTDFVCDNSADTDPTDGLTIVPADANKTITCTIVNSRKSATLQLAKQWINAKVNDNITAAATGFSSPSANAQLNSTANTASETDTGSGVTVYVGDSGAITGETWVTGLAGNYNTTDFVCDNSADTDPTDGLTIVPADATKTITCTIVNSRKSASLRLAKSWNVGPATGDAITAATTGFSAPSNNASLTSTADSATETDTGTAVTVYAGDSGLLQGETFTTGSASDYVTTSWSCDGTDTNPEDGLDIAAGDATKTITCTISNTHKAMISVIKWVNGVEPIVGQWDFTLNGPGGVNAIDSSPPNPMDFGGVKLLPTYNGVTNTYTICEINIPNGVTTDWGLDTTEPPDGIPDVSINGDVFNPDDPMDLGTRCYSFTAKPGETVNIVIDNRSPLGDARTPGYWANWSSCTGGNQYDKAQAELLAGLDPRHITLDENLPQTVGDLDVTDCQTGVYVLQGRFVNNGKKASSDAAYTLARSLMAYLLNTSGVQPSYSCPLAQAAAEDAQMLLDDIGFVGTGRYLSSRGKQSDADAALREAALLLNTTLDMYNNNTLGAMCEP
jgi:hypothetical protein